MSRYFLSFTGKITRYFLSLSEGKKGSFPDIFPQREKKGVSPIFSLGKKISLLLHNGKGLFPALFQSRNNKRALRPQEEVQDAKKSE